MHLLLVRPDDEPDVEPHDRAEPHADADRGVVAVCESPIPSLIAEQIAVHPGEDEAEDDRRTSRPSGTRTALRAGYIWPTPGCSSVGIFGIVGVWVKLKYQRWPIHITPLAIWHQRIEKATSPRQRVLAWCFLLAQAIAWINNTTTTVARARERSSGPKNPTDFS